MKQGIERRVLQLSKGIAVLLVFLTGMWTILPFKNSLDRHSSKETYNESRHYEVLAAFLKEELVRTKEPIYLNDSTCNAQADFGKEAIQERIRTKQPDFSNRFLDVSWNGLLDTLDLRRWSQSPPQKVFKEKLQCSEVRFMNAQQGSLFRRSHEQGRLYSISDIVWHPSFNQCLFVATIGYGFPSGYCTLLFMEKKGNQWVIAYYCELGTS